MGDANRTVAAAFVVVAMLAGGNAVGIRFSNRELDPYWGATVRFGLATLGLLGWLLIRRIPLPRGRDLIGPIVFGLFNYGLAFAFAYYGLTELHAGFGQTVLALVPLLSLLLAVAHGQERLTRAGVVGTMLAASGVAVMSGFSLGQSLPVLAVLALIGGAASFAEAGVLVRQFSRVHPVAMNAVAAGVGTLFLLLLSISTGETWASPDRAETYLAIGYLAFIGSIVVFVLYLFVLDNWPVSRAAYIFVLTPIVTILLSARLDDESLTWGLLVGATLILLGVYVGALRGRVR